MRREASTNRVAGTLHARAKFIEYAPPTLPPLPLPNDFSASKLFPLAIGFIGDYSAECVCDFIQTESQTTTSNDDVAFSAKTFLAYANSRIDEDFRRDLILLSASAFRLVGMPGVSFVQASHLLKVQLDSDYLSKVLIWTLIQPWSNEPPSDGGKLEVHNLARLLSRHYKSGISRESLRHALIELRRKSYSQYEDRDLLLADILSALVISRFSNSTRILLHGYSKTTADSWVRYLSSSRAMHELWPSQIKLGEAGVFAGSSAVVQMPTSAGKTKATELILRTSFSAGRSRLAIIVAPFVALCDEIHDDLSRALVGENIRVNRLGDALQADYIDAFLLAPDESDATPPPHLVVMTPEKLLYVLRQQPEIASILDLVIYDEGHQFDSGARGITYELLLTSIKSRLKRTTQSVLISAVIQNAEDVADWLLGRKASVVVDTSNQTQRSIAFSSEQSGGKLEFLSNSDSEPAFAVPGVMLAQELGRRPRETKPRFFPVLSDSKSVALYLGLRLYLNGGVAVFYGKKDGVASFVKNALDVFSRNPAMLPPSSISDEAEIERLKRLFSENFGEDYYLTEAAKLGIFSHTGGTPRGLRLSIEHAMRAKSICFVVCTSTLAQGVNLPIKYLLVAATQQGRADIRPRDFKNLMGRAGRAGMHEEGAIIFCDTQLYDDRKTAVGLRNRKKAQNLINPDSQDPIGSTLLSLILPFKNMFGQSITEIAQVEITTLLLSSPNRIEEFMSEIRGEFSKFEIDENRFRDQLSIRLDLLKRVESYIMDNLPDADIASSGPSSLAKETLAYHLATDDQKLKLVTLFERIAKGVVQLVPEADTRSRYGRNLLGAQTSLLIDSWVSQRVEPLIACADRTSLAKALWPLFVLASEPARLRQCQPAEALEMVFHGWLSGSSYADLCSLMKANNATYPWRNTRRSYDVDDIVKLCDDLFGFHVPLLVAAIRDSLVVHGNGFSGVRKTSFLLDSLQKQVKYGLPNRSCVALFEAGFSDRVVAQKIEYKLWDSFSDPDSVATAVRDRQSDVEDILEDYPGYFRSVFRSMALQSTN